MASPSEPPSALTVVVFYALALPTILLGIVAIIWVVGLIFPWFDIEIDIMGASVMAVALMVMGLLYGMGVVYGARPNYKIGILNIWLVAIITMIAVALALARFTKEFWPQEWAILEIALVAGAWLVITCLLACIGLSKRNEVIKNARKTATEN